MPSLNKPLLVAIVGPTAVGKTEIAIQLAERLDGEIVSADSRLLYRGMDIGTAKPSREESARVPHHLIDVAEPSETWSLAEFQQAAVGAIEGVQRRGRLPILVGGTGQYVRAILEGWSPPKIAAQPKLRAALETWADEIGKDELHLRLARLDPVAGKMIDSRNLRRTIRALEVTLSTGRKFSESRQRYDSPYRVLQIGLNRPRAELYQRIDERIATMLESGWIAEVSGLLAKGFRPDLPAMSAIGYSQLARHINKEISLKDAIVEIQRASRLFVRRQTNWFKENDPNINWFNAGDEDVVAKIALLVEGARATTFS